MKTKLTSLVIIIITLLLSINVYSEQKRIIICTNSGNTMILASERSYKSQREDGTLICWLQEKNNSSVCIQKINLENNLVWQSNGIVLDSGLGEGLASESDYPLLFSDCNGGAIVIYRKTFLNKEEIFLQKIFSDGRCLRNPVCLSSHYGGLNYSPSASVFENNEIVITWENFYSGDFNIHAQKVDLNGSKLWNNGREIIVCDHESDQRRPVITVDGSNCAFITWLDSRNGLNHPLDLYGNRIDAYGKSLGFGSTGKLIRSMEAGNNFERKYRFYNHYLVASDNNSFITAIENSVSEGYSYIEAMKVNEDLNVEWTVNLDDRSCRSNPLVIKEKRGGADIFWNEFKDDQYNVYGIGIDENGVSTWGSEDGAKISCDIMKNSFERILPSGNNRNGICSNGNQIFLSWVIPQSNNLFLKELNLTDEFKQCSNITEIQKGVSEGEYTSITTQLNNLVVVYYQSNNIYAYVRKLDDNEIQKGRQVNIISNFPNPFNPSTKISFSIPSDGFVRLSVYDITGRIVRILVNEYRLAGSYDEIFDGSNIATGVYFYRLETNGDVTTKKMTLIK